MRTKVELLKILKKYFIKGDPYHQSGLCREVCQLYLVGFIGVRERYLLDITLRANGPLEAPVSGYFWTPVDEDPSTKQVRIDFLDKLIEKYENES